MYKENCLSIRKNDIAFELAHESFMNKYIHWLNPLLFKRKRV